MGRKIIWTSNLCIALFLMFMILLQFDDWSIPTSGVSNSTRIQGTRHLAVEMQMQKDPISSLPLQISHTGIITCDRSHYTYDICTINGPNVLSPTVSTFFAMDPTDWTRSPSSPSTEKIKPYPRKWQEHSMFLVNEITLLSGGRIGPKCEAQHEVPALVFSTGGFTGNLWHDFVDVLIPLFVSANSIFYDQEFVMVIDQSHDWWLNKYGDLLQKLSKQRIIRMDQETKAHCFPWTLIGLISHGLGSINPKWLPNSRTLHHFRDLLADAYGDQNQPFVSHLPSARTRPRLVLARRRRGGRVMLNYVEVKRAIEEAGFEVIEFEPTKTTHLHQNYALLSSSHALLGVHGAALTHLLFLRPGSVLLQIVLLGQDGVAEFFGNPARELGLEYMEYKISVYESSYIEKYGKDDVILSNSTALLKDGWNRELYELYIKYQDVKVDLTRFRPYLEKAYKKAKDFMDRLH